MAASEPRSYYLYLRKSKGRAGISRQRAVTEAHIKRIGGAVAGEFVDTDRTAWRQVGGARPSRPDFDRLLAALAAHPGAGVAAWHADRLLRDPGDTEMLIVACVAGGHLIETPRGGTYDLATATGRKRLRDDANDAAYEVDHMQERMLAQKLETAAAGLPLGGRRAFGYTADGMDLCHGPVIMLHAEAERRGLPVAQDVMTRQGKRAQVILPYDEAAELAAAIERVTRGGTLHAIARDWNARGIRTSSGNGWDAQEAGRVLRKPRNAGLMEHRGQVIGDAAWPPVVDEVTWRKARAILTDPARTTTPGPGRRWLGSGIYECVCGAPMIASSTRGHGVHRAVYRCKTGRKTGTARPGVRHSARDAAALDAYVELFLAEWMAIPGNLARLAPPASGMDALEADIERLRGELDDLAEQSGRLDITARQLAIASKPLIGRLKQLEAQWDAAVQPDLGEGLDLPSTATYASVVADLDRRRALVARIFRVRVLPGQMGRPAGWKEGQPSYFDPDYVEITRRPGM